MVFWGQKRGSKFLGVRASAPRPWPIWRVNKKLKIMVYLGQNTTGNCRSEGSKLAPEQAKSKQKQAKANKSKEKKANASKRKQREAKGSKRKQKEVKGSKRKQKEVKGSKKKQKEAKGSKRK